MQLLLEQKQELDDLREKGIELETATAVTAAAATATAMKAKVRDCHHVLPPFPPLECTIPAHM